MNMSESEISSSNNSDMTYFQKLVETTISDSVLYEQATSSSTIEEVANSIEQQVQLLPTPLRKAVNFALIVLNYEAIIYHRKTFRGLSLETRKVYLRRWETSQIGARRDLVRFVRSMSLFNFYDHPDIREKI